ncbi:MAG TPA: hypothetical protein VE344_09760 [Methylomirabilota bacterium]|nr:hypothetical protein [Methylomirabilota bacterium]
MKIFSEIVSPLYFRHFVAQFIGSMTRRFSILAAIFFAAQIPAFANADDLAKSVVLENDVAYLRVGNVGKDLPGEIRSAQGALAATSKIVGTVLDLRFADGNDFVAEQAAENLFASKKMSLAILVNAETRGAAAKLAVDLRASNAGLIFGSAMAAVKPDVLVSVSVNDEKEFFENPYGTISTNGVHLASATTNDFLPFIDHTTEADLVRAKIKDGEEGENPKPKQVSEPAKPFIHDPVLARGMDFVKGAAIFRLSHS